MADEEAQADVPRTGCSPWSGSFGHDLPLPVMVNWMDPLASEMGFGLVISLPCVWHPLVDTISAETGSPLAHSEAQTSPVPIPRACGIL